MKTKNKTIKKIIAGGMAFVCACTAGIVGFATNWFGAGNVEGFEQNNQLSFGSFFGSGLSLAVASAETVDATSKGKTTLSVTVTPAELAPYVKVDWSVAWQNADSEWATGKTVTDYVTVTPTADGALTAEVACKAAFGEKVVVSVSVRDDATLKAECICDYQARIDEITVLCLSRQNTWKSGADATNTENRVDLQEGDIQYDNTTEFSIESVSGLGTLPASNWVYNNQEIKLSLSPKFKAKLQEHGFTIISDSPSGSVTNSVWLPGCYSLEQASMVSITKVIKYAYDMGVSASAITDDDIATYMSYRAAVEETVSSGEDGGSLGVFSVSYFGANETLIRAFYAKVYAPSGYLPSITEAVSFDVTNVKF